MENPTESQLFTDLTRLNSRKFMIHVVGDYCAIGIALAFYSYHPSVFTFLFASIITGLAQHALAILGHEAVHYRIANDRRVNDLVGNIFCFFPASLTVSTYREFHLPHHRYLGQEKDPELPLRQELGKSWQGPFETKRALKLWAFSFVGGSLRELGVFLKMLPFGSLKEKLGLATVWTLAGALCVMTHHSVFIGIWIFALCTTYFSMIRFQGWYEHSLGGTSNTNRYEIPHSLFRIALPHNIWVHYEHHKYPSVPFYNLEKVRLLDQSAKIYEFDDMVRAIENENHGELEVLKQAS